MASLVKGDPALLAKYSRPGRTIEYHRAQIRKAYGTRPPTEVDEDRWARWLAGGDVPDGDQPGPAGRGGAAAVPKREGEAANQQPD